VIIPFAQRRLAAAVALAAAILGTCVALHYHRLGLTLTHYDARGHLIVARRIFDSITPGWQQIGAVWLPLPHLLNAVPVQNDFLYRTGASAVAISIASFAIGAASIAAIVGAITGSSLAAVAGSVVFALNPNVLYLQSTPMTEPLLIALTCLAIAALLTSVSAATGRRDRSAVVACGLLFAMACLTRYEAWPVTVAALVLLWAVHWPPDRQRNGVAADEHARRIGGIALYPLAAIVGFAVFSRVVVGQWFVAGDFFVPENKSLGDWWMAIKEIAWGTQMLSAAALVWIGGIGMAVAAAVGLFDARKRLALVTLALGATAVVPFAAFYRGHPFRIRYMVPLIAVEAVGCGLAAGAFRRVRVPASLTIIAIALATLRPLDAAAPMVLEAQWDAPNLPVRASVTACLQDWRPGQKIMASMGSLGHYMQEAAAAGFQIRDFLHEGNGDIWLAALDRPRPFADWMLIEEKAEGGDSLAHLAREHPAFLDGYQRLCEGAGLVLYRRMF
jgi:hypothetical protein